MQTIAHEGARVETGAVQFGDDWPGVFIRGDNAFALAMPLQALLNGHDDPLTRAQVGGLLSLLRSSNVHADARLLESQGTPTPAADEVEALDLLFQIDNLDPAEIVKSPSFVKETVREAIAALQAKANG